MTVCQILGWVTRYPDLQLVCNKYLAMHMAARLVSAHDVGDIRCAFFYSLD